MPDRPPYTDDELRVIRDQAYSPDCTLTPMWASRVFNMATELIQYREEQEKKEQREREIRERRSPNYTEPLSRWSFGDLMTIEEWRESVATGCFIDDDGSGHPVEGDRVFVNQDCFYDCTSTTTHVIWFNR